MANKLPSDRMAKFAKEYLVDLNATQAAIRAGYSIKTARQKGSELLGRDDVQAAIQVEMGKRAQRTEIRADDVLQYWHDIATANPNEIIHLRRVCCRHCYGQDHQYQWRDEEEYRNAVTQVIRSAKENEEPIIPSDDGGYGFNRLLDPNERCPYCLGEGNPEMHINDTRKLTGKARLLFAGIKQTQTGIEIKFRDQDKAMENVARHLGMFVDRHELTGNMTFDIVPAPKPEEVD